MIVVDELTMMGMEARGPKLEVALEIAMQRLQTELRVVCLTTINCSVEYIQKWLNHTLPHELPGQDDNLEEDYGDDVEPDDNGVEVIEGLTRPVGLEENIITLDDGMCYTKYTPGENDEEDVPTPEENKPERFLWNLGRSTRERAKIGWCGSFCRILRKKITEKCQERCSLCRVRAVRGGKRSVCGKNWLLCSRGMSWTESLSVL